MGYKLSAQLFPRSLGWTHSRVDKLYLVALNIINACVHKRSQKSLRPKHVILPKVSEVENNVWSFILRN